MNLLIFAEILVNLNIKLVNRFIGELLQTYHAFGDSWREAHLVTWLSFIVKVSASLQETIDGVKEALDAVG